MIPYNPRCVSCHTPFAGIGGRLGRMGLIGSRPSAKNPRFCAACDAFNARYPGGTEVVLTMLFVDVRGSTTLAEEMSAADFSKLMNRFYEAAIQVLVKAAGDFTALGDNVNIAVRLAPKAGPGKVLISEATWDAAQLGTEGIEKRDLELKGKSELVRVRVLHAAQLMKE